MFEVIARATPFVKHPDKHALIELQCRDGGGSEELPTNPLAPRRLSISEVWKPRLAEAALSLSVSVDLSSRSPIRGGCRGPNHALMR
jgi:hypothetical protein